MSLRRRLTLSLFTILILFSLNVATHFWGSYARSESMIAYRNSVNAGQRSTEIEQLLEDQRQQILVLATLRDTTEDRLDAGELAQAEGEVDTITRKIQQLGNLSHDTTREQYQNLWQSSNNLLNRWLDFYRNYNDPAFQFDLNNSTPYREVSRGLKELEQRQAFIAQQRAAITDRTIALTDRITVIGFLASIFLTAILGFFLVRFTNSSLKRLNRYRTYRQWRSQLPYRQDR